MRTRPLKLTAGVAPSSEWPQNGHLKARMQHWLCRAGASHALLSVGSRASGRSSAGYVRTMNGLDHSIDAPGRLSTPISRASSKQLLTRRPALGAGVAGEAVRPLRPGDPDGCGIDDAIHKHHAGTSDEVARPLTVIAGQLRRLRRLHADPAAGRSFLTGKASESFRSAW